MLPDFDILFIDYFHHCQLIPQALSSRQFPAIYYGNCRDSTADAIQTWNGTLIRLSLVEGILGRSRHPSLGKKISEVIDQQEQIR